MIGSQHRSTADVVPFPGPAARRPRRIPAAAEPLGAILLYTGVRYERQSEPVPGPHGERPPHPGAADLRRQG